jgi:Domain of unknown function (DUF1905)
MSPDLARFLRDELGEGESDIASWDVSSPLWQWRGTGKDGGPSSPVAWFFVTIDGDIAAAIRNAAARTAAWGSVYVTVEVGATKWQTSLFPSKQAGGYLLPMKAAVRKAEKIVEADIVNARVSICRH